MPMRRATASLLIRLISGHGPEPWPVLGVCAHSLSASHVAAPRLSCSSHTMLTAPCISSIHTSTALQYAKKGGRDKGGRQDKGAAAASEEVEEQDFDIAPFERLMSQAVQHFQQELGKIHTGRASPGLLEPIEVVKQQHERVPLKACGTVTARTASLLVVTVYNDQDLDVVAKAIRESPLKLQARVEGKEIHVPVPRPTLEQIQGMQRLVKQEAEKTRVAVRGARHKALDRVKATIKAKDFIKRANKEVQDVTDRYTSDLERLIAAKDKELHELR